MSSTTIYQFVRRIPSIGILAIALVIVIVLTILYAPVSALPEYASRTDSSCAACHVSPGGGGPLTLGGMGWIGAGRPDAVPEFEAVLLLPGVSDPEVLYDVACVTCHGTDGEGLSASRLAGFEFGRRLVRRSIVDGLADFGMPGFEGQFTDEQLEALTAYVSDLSSGRIVPPVSYPLAEGALSCGSGTVQSSCGGN